MLEILNNKYIMNKIIILILSLVLISCKKQDYVDEFELGDYKVRREFKSGKIVNSKSFDKKGILQMEVFYKNDTIYKVQEYYPNKKIKVKYSFVKDAKDYYTETFYENGVMASVGVVDLINENNNLMPLRKQGWIYFSKTKESYNISIFAHNWKNEFLTRETIFDTINNGVLQDNFYDPPIPIIVYEDKGSDLLFYPVEKHSIITK